MTQSRLHELSLAITEYGEASISIMHRVKALGNSVVAALPGFLGDDAKVRGVDPTVPDWRMTDYRDQKFSFHGAGTLEVDAIQMGVAVCIPHIKDDGELCVRVIVDFIPDGGDLRVAVGDRAAAIGVSEPYQDFDVRRICEEIFDYLRATFADPVAIAMARRSGKIGFMA